MKKEYSLTQLAEHLLGWQLEPAQRQLLEADTHRVLLNCSRQWGKSTLAAVAILHHLIYTRDALVLIAGPSLRQSAELLRKTRQLAAQLGLALKGDGVNRHSAVYRRGRVVALPASADTIRGYTRVTFLLIDEAAMVDDDIYHTIRPMLTQNNGDIWLLSTPKGQQGFFHREAELGHEPWARITARADQSPRFTPEQLATERAALGDKKFNQEFLCEFISLDGALFEAHWFKGVETDEVKPLAA